MCLCLRDLASGCLHSLYPTLSFALQPAVQGKAVQSIHSFLVGSAFHITQTCFIILFLGCACGLSQSCYPFSSQGDDQSLFRNYTLTCQGFLPQHTHVLTLPCYGNRSKFECRLHTLWPLLGYCCLSRQHLTAYAETHVQLFTECSSHCMCIHATGRYATGK